MGGEEVWVIKGTLASEINLGKNFTFVSLLIK